MHDIPLQKDAMTQFQWGTYLKEHLHDMRLTSQAFYNKDIWQNSFCVWMCQPHCQTCFAQENLTVCETCGCVARCDKPVCQEAFKHTHSAMSCECHCIRLAAYVMAKQQSNYLKVSSLSRNTIQETTDLTASSSSSGMTTLTRLPSSWGAYWTEKITDYEVPEMLLRLPPVMAMLTDSMSYVFTAMHCLQQLHVHRAKHASSSSAASTASSSTLCIHFIGADVLDVFGAQAGVFEEILHWFPHVTQLELVLIGPDLQADREGERRLVSGSNEASALCNGCVAKHCSIYLTCIRALYHEAVEQHKLSTEYMPTIAVLCNSGLHEGTSSSSPGSLANTWAPTLEMLYDQRIPIVATSYTWEEARDDVTQLAAVLGLELETISGSEVNGELEKEKGGDEGGLARMKVKVTWGEGEGESEGRGAGGELVIPPSRNPFRGLLPMPDTLCDNKFFYNNNYYFMLAQW